MTTLRRAKWFVELYRHGGRLWLRHRRRRFALEQGMTAELTTVFGPTKRLTIRSDGEVAWSCTYWQSLWNLVVNPLYDFTAIDHEDYDFGFMVANVLEDPRRFREFQEG